jgi:ABC-type Fe3+/spermidine/putrescine transport system ATPase subunit
VSALISIRGLRKAYGESVAVDGIDLEVQGGEVMALLGPSGCGKTTTLQLLAGFLRPDAGEIRVGERVLSSPRSVVPPERRQMSLIFQSYAVWPHKTVRQNVAFGLQVRRTPRAELTARVAAVLKTVRLERLADRYPAELSGGQQQRVALARAIVVQPQILLLDEPLSNLDANLREEMRFEIRRLHDQTGITMVYVTHDQAEAMALGDRIVVMSHGAVEQVGRPREIYFTPANRFVAEFVGTMNRLRGVVRDGHLEVAGGRIPWTGPRAGETEVLFRPERARLVEAPEGALTGRLLTSFFLGDRTRLVVEGVGEAPLILEASAGREFRPGQAVHVAIDPDALLTLPR